MPVTLVVSSSIAVAACTTATEESESTSAVAVATNPAEVTKWNRIAGATLAQFPGPAGGAAPAVQIHLAMVQGAVYDAVNAITPKHHRPYLLKRRFSARASGTAAVATAAHDVLVDIITSVPATIAFTNRAALLAAVDSEYALSLGAVPDSVFKVRGIEAGAAAAKAMIDARKNDGRFGSSQWVPNPNVGHWDPGLPTTGTLLDPTPWIGGVKPFMMHSPSQFRSPGPRALTSAGYTTDFNEVKRIGGNAATGSERTDEQTDIALYWQSAGGPSLMWSGAARGLADDPSSGLDFADTARLLAMMNLSGADAAINCWNDKYHYDFWRPFQAIRRAADDGNPDTEAVDGWAPLISSPYPDHTSGHLCIDGAHLTVLQTFFETDDMDFGVTSSFEGGTTRFFHHFSQPLDEIVEARIWAGLHFRTADVQGRDIGINVAHFMADNFFQPVGNAVACQH